MAAETLDVITYSGEINSSGYESVCQALAQKRSQKALLVLATPGGDPHAGFRIARALQHGFETFDLLVPRYCKSAGTLIAIGASTLWMDDSSELGPLDVQVKKGDELLGRNSGLDIFQAVNYLQAQSMSAFRNYLLELASDGLSTRIASEIASGLTSSLFQPIIAQIDPLKLAEMQRATEIAYEYGTRLNGKSGNMRATGIQRLVSGYPSHGFVIDRKEARGIFINVKRPTGFMSELSTALRVEMDKNLQERTSLVKLFTVTLIEEVAANEDAPDAPSGQGSAQISESEIAGHRQAIDSSAASADGEQSAPQAT